MLPSVMYANENQTDWDEFIPIALFSYRTSLHETTLQSPFGTFYGREARLLSELDMVTSKSSEFVKDLKHKWKSATERIKEVNKQRKEKFDSKHKEYY